MKIQRITYKGHKGVDSDYIVESNLNNPQTLDGFDYNIVDLSDKELWVNGGSNTYIIDDINDLESFSSMISGASKTIIIVLPQNIDFTIENGYDEASFHDYVQLKYMLDNLCMISSSLLSSSWRDVRYFELLFENTKTSLNDVESSAAFHFGKVEKLYDWNRALTISIHGGKVTTIEIDNERIFLTTASRIIMTTLELDTESKIACFLESTNLVNHRETAPSWFADIRKFDDDKQIAQIAKCKDIILQQENLISKSESSLEKNNRYKSILYTLSKELVTIVFEIFTEMLGCHRNDFVDVNNEDFLFEVDDITFIGEIKGVTRNVKGENVAQLDIHYRRYMDNEENSDKRVKALLVINHQRELPLDERKEVPVNQIQIAKRNGSLIVEATTLLDLFEKYRRNEMEREECIRLLYENTGLLTL